MFGCRLRRRRRVGLKVGEDGLQRRLEKELAVRPGAQPRLCVPAMQSSDLHQPLGSKDRRWTRRGRADSGEIRLQEHGTGKSAPWEVNLWFVCHCDVLLVNSLRRSRRGDLAGQTSEVQTNEPSPGWSDFVLSRVLTVQSHSEAKSPNTVAQQVPDSSRSCSVRSPPQPQCAARFWASHLKVSC